MAAIPVRQAWLASDADDQRAGLPRALHGPRNMPTRSVVLSEHQQKDFFEG
jgi:hypothetical protein